MISLELLRKTGNVEALITLVKDTDLTVGELSETMGLHESTVRQRMNELEEASLVTSDAAIVGNQPVRVWTATDNGKQIATSLASLITDYTPKADGEPTGEDSDGTVDVATGKTEKTQAD